MTKEKFSFSFNVLSEEFADYVLDPSYFGGQCDYVYNGEWRKFTYEAFCESLQYRDDEKNYRKPYNYHTYQFMVPLSGSLCDLLSAWECF